jgi:hypothetical protein
MRCYMRCAVANSNARKHLTYSQLCDVYVQANCIVSCLRRDSQTRNNSTEYPASYNTTIFDVTSFNHPSQQYSISITVLV